MINKINEYLSNDFVCKEFNRGTATIKYIGSTNIINSTIEGKFNHLVDNVHIVNKIELMVPTRYIRESVRRSLVSHKLKAGEVDIKLKLI